jgi:hypothetical protein
VKRDSFFLDVQYLQDQQLLSMSSLSASDESYAADLIKRHKMSQYEQSSALATLP